jgi:hypothetical protein
MQRARLAILTALALSAGCRHLAANDDVPAVLVAPTAEVRAELRAALAAALGQAPAAIAEDALTRTNVLIIERAPVRDIGNVPAAGRTLEPNVHRFELVLAARECVLLRPADAWRMRIASATCRPL